MEKSKAIALTSNNVPAIPDAQSLAALRLDKSVPHYKDVDKGSRIGWLKEKILTLGMIRHQVAESWQVEFDATILDDFIMDDRYASDYTFPEIWDAFRRGLMGDYGEYFGLTAESLFGFIRGYSMSDKKRKAADLVRQSRKAEVQVQEELFRNRFRLQAEQIAKQHKI